MHPLFLALTRWINITNIFNLALGIGIAIRYAKPAGFAGGVHWLAVPLWLVIGMTTQLLVRFAFSISISGPSAAGRSRACTISSSSSRRSPTRYIQRRSAI